MTTAPGPPRNPIAQAIEVLDFGLRACEAYGRTDLTGRLGAIRRQLADPAVHIVVAGEFKQGKSSLVNGLLGANVCPVDDDVATALPTYVRHNAEPKAFVLHDGDPPRREPIALDQVRAYAVENNAGPTGGADRVIGVDVQIPRKILEGGLVLVDTPGVGGLGSAHAAASLAAISMADAVIFVTDASQELTRSEVDFVRQARQLCRTVVCVMTKIDFYPAWRTIHDLNAGHLRSIVDVPLMAVSSSLRTRAVKANDQALNAESGFADLVRFVTDQVGGKAADRIAGDAAAEVSAVCEQILAQFEAERAALVDPAAAQQVLDRLNLAKQRVEVLRSNAAKWLQTLSDGIADLNADIDHDLRARIRQVLQESDDSVEDVDPADTWPQMESWLRSRVSYDLLANYTLLRSRADALSEEVADHFRYASGEVFDQLGVYNPAPQLEGARVDHKIELDKMKVGKQAMVALKSAYGGALMFMMLGTMTGIALGPISVGIGLVMGAKGLRDEKKRQLQNRRTQAKNAVRRYCDEVSFVMGKDSRDTLRRVQRQLRDYYSGLAEELARSNQEGLSAATEAAKRTQAERDQRLRDLDSELTRLRQLRQRSAAIVSSAVGS
jgi:hypothetical protein